MSLRQGGLMNKKIFEDHWHQLKKKTKEKLKTWKEEFENSPER